MEVAGFPASELAALKDGVQGLAKPEAIVGAAAAESVDKQVIAITKSEYIIFYQICLPDPNLQVQNYAFVTLLNQELVQFCFQRSKFTKLTVQVRPMVKGKKSYPATIGGFRSCMGDVD